MLGRESVLITDHEGIVENIVSRSEAGSDIETYSGLLSPGFINCHCHLELSHMRDLIPRHTGMIKFLLGVMSGRTAEEQSKAAAMELAEAAMIGSGIVAVGDICNTGDTIAVKRKKNIFYHNFIEVTGFSDAIAEVRFNKVAEVYAEFIKDGSHRVSIAPHSPYSVSDKLFQLISAHSKGSLLTIHNQESIAETEFFTSGKGELLELYKALNIDITHFVPSTQSSLIRSIIQITGDHAVILVHNVNTTADDLDEIRRGRNLPELFWCLCPNANLYINNQLPDVDLLKNFDCTMVVGTDSLASNSQLSILEELKTLQSNFNGLTVTELLTWATINGAKALRIDDMFGTFAKGKQPGIVNITGGNIDSLQNSMSKRIL